MRTMPPWPATRSLQWTHLARAYTLGGHKQTHIHPLGRPAAGTLNTLPLGMLTYRLTHVLGCGPYVCNWIARCPVFMYYGRARLIRKKMKRLIRDMLISLPLCSLESAGTGTVGWRKRGRKKQSHVSLKAEREFISMKILLINITALIHHISICRWTVACLPQLPYLNYCILMKIYWT